MTNDNKPGPILVPVDFSEYSETALLYAAELAEMMKSPLIVLHVVHDPPDSPGYYKDKGDDNRLARLEDLAEDMLKDFLQRLVEENPGNKALHEMSTMLVAGLPVTRILEAAENSHARMIVMGSQGRTGLSHLMLGSKAEQIVRLAPIPVTIVKGRDEKKSG